MDFVPDASVAKAKEVKPKINLGQPKKIVVSQVETYITLALAKQRFELTELLPSKELYYNPKSDGEKTWLKK